MNKGRDFENVRNYRQNTCFTGVILNLSILLSKNKYLNVTIVLMKSNLKENCNFLYKIEAENIGIYKMTAQKFRQNVVPWIIRSVQTDP